MVRANDPLFTTYKHANNIDMKIAGRCPFIQNVSIISYKDLRANAPVICITIIEFNPEIYRDEKAKTPLSKFKF
jgi:hypothetical protein